MAKKVTLNNELDYIQKALNDGRATLQPVSLGALEGKPGEGYQMRASPINMDHVYTLARLRDAFQKLGPIVVFLCLLTKRMVVAEGHHRWKEALIRGDASIEAYVIESDNVECDAVLFATMCNQHSILNRTEEDIKKAAFALFRLPGWLEKSSVLIGLHLGVSKTTVNKYLALYSNDHGISLPERTTGLDGSSRPRRVSNASRKQPGGMPRITRGRCSHSAGIGGKNYTLSSNPLKAAQELEDIIESRKSAREEGCRYLNQDAIRRFFHRRNLFFSPSKRFSQSDVCGSYGHSCIYITSMPSGDESPSQAVGRLVLLSAYFDAPPGTRLVILCYLEFSFLGRQSDLDLARKIGIEFLTPEEFVASLTGEQDVQATTD